MWGNINLNTGCFWGNGEKDCVRIEPLRSVKWKCEAIKNGPYFLSIVEENRIFTL